MEWFLFVSSRPIMGFIDSWSRIDKGGWSLGCWLECLKARAVYHVSWPSLSHRQFLQTTTWWKFLLEFASSSQFPNKTPNAILIIIFSVFVYLSPCVSLCVHSHTDVAGGESCNPWVTLPAMRTHCVALHGAFVSFCLGQWDTLHLSFLLLHQLLFENI